MFDNIIKKLFGQNWKTTVAGILTLAGLSLQCIWEGGNIIDCILEAWPVAFAGIGLFFAGDAKKSAPANG